MPTPSFEYRTAPPSPECATFVQHLFFARGAPGYERETLIPMGHPTLLVNLGAPFERFVDGSATLVAGGTLHFQQTFAAEHVYRGETHVVGAALTPDGAFALLGRDVSPYTNGVMGMSRCWPEAWAGVEASLTATATDAEVCLARLDAALCDHDASAPDDLVHACLAALDREPGRAIARIADHERISHKQLLARFKTRVGTPPKAFAALLRMRRVAEAAAAPTGSTSSDSASPDSFSPDWTQLAAEAGYADQAHFSRAFKRFTGLSPTAYARRRRWSEEAVGLEDASGSFVPHPDPAGGQG